MGAADGCRMSLATESRRAVIWGKVVLRVALNSALLAFSRSICPICSYRHP